MNTWTFIAPAGKATKPAGATELSYVGPLIWFNARRQAARAFGCADQDVTTALDLSSKPPNRARATSQKNRDK